MSSSCSASAESETASLKRQLEEMKKEKEAAEREAKKAKAAAAAAGATDETVIEVGGNPLLRVRISKFRNNPSVDIRKFYKKQDGEPAPTKKGISLNADQWRALTSHFGEIEEALSALEG